MQIAVLPLNAGPETRPALARQLSNFACEIARNVTGQEIHAVNYMAQIDTDAGQKFAMVNPSETLNESEMIAQFFTQADMNRIVDGLLVENPSGGGTVTIRVWERGNGEPIDSEEFPFLPGGFFGPARGFVQLLVDQMGHEFPEELNKDENLFGTTDPNAFVEFMLGFDAAQYIEKAQGQVALEFDPSAAFASLEKALELDSDWEAPYLTALNLGRMCTQSRIGDAAKIEDSLKSLTQREPEDPRGWFALGDFYGTIGNPQGAAENMEKAVVKLQMKAAQLRKESQSASNADEKAILAEQAEQMAKDEAPILARLGMAQMAMNMPANAERNFRRAVELEPAEKPTMGLLAQVLTQTGRAHEVPPMLKELLDSQPENAQNHVNYAMSLLQAGKKEDARRAFEVAIEKLEETTLPKRYFAAFLAQEGELDPAMDYYEDVIEVVPNDVQVLLEYAQTLQNANRNFEIPKVLKDVLALDIDPNTRSQTQAWLLRLEQPKRVEAVASAAQKLQEGDAESALKELKPLKNWLSDYFELWMYLADALNRVGEYKEAEQSANQLLTMFPGCEPGYALLAAALHGQERSEDAYNFLRMALANNQTSLTIALNFAQAAFWTNRTEEGRALVAQIREATGNDEQIGNILDQMEQTSLTLD